MGSIFDRTDAWLMATLFAVVMILAWAGGWWLERKLKTQIESDNPGTKFTDATMALLGLLLGFTFSMALGRHEHRRSSMVSETNAIGDFYTCASLIKEPHRSALQELTKGYAEAKLQLANQPTISEADFRETIRAFQKTHQKMTTMVRSALRDEAQMTEPLTNTLNALISSHSARKDAFRDRLPTMILVLLLFCSAVPAFLMGRQQGVTKRLHLAGPVAFIFLVTLVIYVTLDLNQPGRGTIVISQEPLKDLIGSFGE